MPLYTFYPRLRDGSALTFDAIEFEDDQAAMDHGRLVLSEHPSASQVIVWEGDRRVYRMDRVGPPIARATPRRDVVRP